MSHANNSVQFKWQSSSVVEISWNLTTIQRFGRIMKVHWWEKLAGPAYNRQLTFLTYCTSGWYFGGINIIMSLSTNWIPANEQTPRYNRTPNITGTGMRWRAGARRMDKPATEQTCQGQETIQCLFFLSCLFHRWLYSGTLLIQSPKGHEDLVVNHACQENIHTPPPPAEEIGISWRVGGGVM